MEKLRLYDQPINRRAFIGVGLGALLTQGCSVFEQQNSAEEIVVDDRIILPPGANVPTREDIMTMFRYGTRLDQITQAFNSEGGFLIDGEPEFVKEIQKGLLHMLILSPTYFAPIAYYVTSIRQGWFNHVVGGSKDIEITRRSSSYSVTYSGSIVLHEAIHVQNLFVGNNPVFGKVGEAKSLGVQANYLEAVGDKPMAAYIRGLIGVWE